ncbi:Protein of unknown function [Gryllus bimaculatus]|nr:Protein of unknown function [Gryllus bimaculatus]
MQKTEKRSLVLNRAGNNCDSRRAGFETSFRPQDVKFDSTCNRRMTKREKFNPIPDGGEFGSLRKSDEVECTNLYVVVPWLNMRRAIR